MLMFNYKVFGGFNENWLNEGVGRRLGGGGACWIFKEGARGRKGNNLKSVLTFEMLLSHEFQLYLLLVFDTYGFLYLLVLIHAGSRNNSWLFVKF